MAAAERAKDTQLSEATRKKLSRRALLMTAEVKAEFSKAVAQLRHAAHHYKHARGEIEKALRQRDRKVLEYSRCACGRSRPLFALVESAHFPCLHATCTCASTGLVCVILLVCLCVVMSCTHYFLLFSCA